MSDDRKTTTEEDIDNYITQSKAFSFRETIYAGKLLEVQRKQLESLQAVVDAAVEFEANITQLKNLETS